MTDPAGADAEVRIVLVGSFAVTRAGSVLGGAELGSRKARLIVKLLAAERGRLVPVSRIIDVLWAAEPAPARAVENVATLVSRLRRTLGTGAVEGGRQGYQLGSPPTVQVDLDLAARWIREGRERVASGEPGLGLAAAERAHDLVAGAALLTDEPDAEWAEPARAELTGLLREARHTLAVSALAAGVPARAVVTASAARADDPYDEIACRLLMRAHARLGEPSVAITAYAELRDLLGRELGTDPAAETQALHLSLLRDEPPATASTGSLPGAASPGGAFISRACARSGDRRAGRPGGADARVA